MGWATRGDDGNPCGIQPCAAPGRRWAHRSWAVTVSVAVLLTVAAQVPWTQSAAVLPKRLALHALAVVCLFRTAGRLRLGLTCAWACAFAAWQALAWAASEVQWLGLPRLMDGMAVLALLVAVMGGRLPRRVLLWPLVVVGGLGAMLGLLEQWIELPGLVQATRPSSFFVGRAVAGEYVAASLILTVGFLLGRRRSLAITLVALQVAFLVSTRSRTGWVVAALGLLWVGSRLAAKEKCAVGATLALAVALAVLLTPGPRLAWHAQRPYAESVESLARMELGGRLDTWLNTLMLVGTHPWLGLGPGGFAATYPNFHRAVVRDRAFSACQQIEEPHNEWLRGAAEWGLPGLALGGILLGAILRGVPRRPSRRTAALLATLVALGIASLVSLTFAAPPTLLLATCVAGMLGRSARGRRIQTQPIVARAVAAALAGLLAWVDVPHWQASRQWRQAEIAATQGHLRSAYERLRAAALNTHDAMAYARVAEIARQAGDASRCSEAAREGLGRTPLSTRLLSLLGECEALQGNTSAAQDAYTRELRVLPDDPYALWGLAQLATGASRAVLVRQAIEASRLEWTLLPPELAWHERARLQSLSQALEAEAARTSDP